MLESAKGLLSSGFLISILRRLARVKPTWPAAPSLGREINLPYSDHPQNGCFGCSKTNPRGLGLRFREAEGWDLAAEWRAEPGHDGYPGMVHGGIILTVLDELLSSCVFYRIGHMAVTAEIRSSMHKPARVGERLRVAARIVAKHDKYYISEAYLFREDGKVAARGQAICYTPPIGQFQRLANLSEVPSGFRGWFAPDPSR